MNPSIIFDLGNVIIDIDPSKTVQAFEQLIPEAAGKIREQILKTEFFHDFETGKIDNPSFRQGIREIYQNNLSDEQIDEAWNALLLEIPQERIALLENLRQTHRIFLLSNTNDLHVRWIEDYMDRKQMPSLEILFEQVYYSHLMDKRKPQPAIYQQVLTENQLTATETVFIDDNAENVAAAQTLGIRGIHLDPDKNTVMDFFQLDAQGNYQLLS